MKNDWWTSIGTRSSRATAMTNLHRIRFASFIFAP